jgi:indoleamine 2,3-dioxygenase
MNVLSPEHFLSLPRPDVLLGPPTGVPDTTTLAAHDFDVDTRTGFMPPEEPLTRLPDRWGVWEDTLDVALKARLQLGEKLRISQEEIAQSNSWRRLVREVRVLRSISDMSSDVP